MSCELKSIPSLWEKYHRTHSTTNRNKLFDTYKHLVEIQAKRIYHRVPQQVTYEELCSAGADGLIDAICRFDPAKGVKFETFSSTRIYGAVMDWLRTLDTQSRTVRNFERDRHRAIDRAQSELGRHVTDDEVAEQMSIPAKRYLELSTISEAGKSTVLSDMNRFSDNSADEDAKGCDLQDKSQEDPSCRIARQMITDYITRGLTRDERLVLILYYYEQITMAEIGKVLGLSESRVSQMHKDLLVRLRRRLQTCEYEELVA